MKIGEKALLIVVAAALCGFLGVILLTENGLRDQMRLRSEKQSLLEENNALAEQNITMYHEIDRLKHDRQYVEEVARRELGVVGEKEIVIKFGGGARK